MRILVLSVGGSLEPLVSSIKQNGPDRLAFVCSDDTEHAKGSYNEVEKVVAQAGAGGLHRDIVRIKDMDNPNACYVQSLDLLTSLRRDYPHAEIIADYTGGTKSISVGLVSAALDTEGVTLGFQQGLRRDLNKIVSGTQFTCLVRQHAPVLNRRRQSVARFFGQYDYPAAISALEDLLAIPDFEPAIGEPLKAALTLARALNAWDRFDHATAWSLLVSFQPQYSRLVGFLEAVVWSRRRLDPRFNQAMSGQMDAESKGHGYELVQDLLLNAERRVIHGRYDDAVGRLYRAVELLAQARLKYGHGIKTDSLQIDRLPQTLRAGFEERRRGDGRIQLGLKESYELLGELAGLGDEPLGQVYSSQKGRMDEFLLVRNRSLFAHGLTPIAERDYLQTAEFAMSFCSQGIQSVVRARETLKPYAEPIQFPQSVAGVVPSVDKHAVRGD